MYGKSIPRKILKHKNRIRFVGNSDFPVVGCEFIERTRGGKQEPEMITVRADIVIVIDITPTYTVIRIKDARTRSLLEDCL